MQRPRRVLLTVLIVNTFVNVGFFAVSYTAGSASGAPHPALSALSGLLSLGVVIIVGEILPKAIALANARRLAPIAAPVVQCLHWVTAPFSAVLQFLLIEPIVRLIAPAGSTRGDISTAELSALVELSADQGIITAREHDMLQTVVALPDISVRSVMVPRVRVQAIAHDADRKSAAAVFARTGLAKLPVYERDLDNILGLLYARDFHLKPQTPFTRLLRPVNYVPEAINLLQLVRHFRKTRTQLAIVVDEYGGIDGLITIQDVLAEIVGDLETGALRGPPDVEQLADGAYRLPGSLSIRAWRPLLGLTDRLLYVDTFGGLIVAQLGRFPQPGDTVRLRNLSLTVDRVDHRRVERVIVRAEASAPQGAE